MKKFNWPAVIAIAFLIGALALYMRSMSKPPKEKHTPPRTNVENEASPEKQEIKVDGRTVIGAISSEQKKRPETIKANNKPSPLWEKELLQTITKNGGETIQNVSIKKVDSVIWMKNSAGINAESVIITLRNKEGAESTFRALVDSATGRILETWDRTIFEPVGRRDHHEHSIMDYRPLTND